MEVDTITVASFVLIFQQVVEISGTFFFVLFLGCTVEDLHAGSEFSIGHNLTHPRMLFCSNWKNAPATDSSQLSQSLSNWCQRWTFCLVRTSHTICSLLMSFMQNFRVLCVLGSPQIACCQQVLIRQHFSIDSFCFSAKVRRRNATMTLQLLLPRLQVKRRKRLIGENGRATSSWEVQF